MKFQTSYFLCFCFLIGTLHADEAPTTLKARQPHWQAVIEEVFSNGSPRLVLFIDPIENNAPKKLLQYQEGGSVAAESDVIPDPSRKYVLHGPTVQYEDEVVATIEFYNHGILSNHTKTYYPNGILASYTPIEDGKPHGIKERYHPNGEIAEKTGYNHGTKSGKSELFYDSGSRQEICNYRDGLYDGEAISWYPDEKKQAHYVYSKGLLSGNKQQIALTRYHQNGRVAETLDFRQGQPVGPHILNDTDGNEIQKTTYVIGQQTPQQPSQPTVTLYPNGSKKRQYSLVNHRYEGDYTEWYSNGSTHFLLHFANDEPDGIQEEFYPDGSIKVRAHYLQGQKHGSYKEWHPNGSTAISVEFIDGKKNGKVTSTYSNGQKSFEGTFSQDIPTETHQSWHDNGTLVYAATYSQGLLEGPELSFYPDGTPRVQAYYRAGKLEGPYSSFYENGKKFEVLNYSQNHPTGHCVLYYPSENEEEQQISKSTNYIDGKFDGEQISYYPTGLKQAILTYHNGILHGYKASWDDEGALLEEATYVNGSLDGRFFQRKPDNRIVIYYYKNNILDGPHTVFHPADPTLIIPQKPIIAVESFYKDGQVEGEVAEYNPAGNKIASTHYLHGLKEGITELYSNKGAVLYSIEFHNDLQNGPAKEFYRNGKIKKEVNFVDDVKEGEERSYHRNGQIASSKTYLHDELHGMTSEWSPEGILIFVADYDNGKRSGRFDKFNEKGEPVLRQIYRDDILIEKKKE